MVGTFKANNPYNTFLLFVYGLLLKLPMFLHPVMPTPQQTDGFLFKWLLMKLGAFGGDGSLLYPIIAYVLLCMQAISFNRLAMEQKMMQKPNYLTAMSYLLVTSLFREWNVLSAPLIINSLLIWVWAKMSGMYSNSNPKTSLFNIGIVIGLCTFFYFPSIVFALLIVVGLAVTRPFRLSEWLVALIGIITPYYFLLTIAFLTDNLKEYRFPAIAVKTPMFYESRWALAAIIIVIIAALIGLYYIQKNFLRQLVQTRKSWNLVFLYFAIAFFVPFVNAKQTFQYWILCAVPMSIFVAGAFLYPEKKWFAGLLHWLMVAFVVAFGYLVK